ncbi:MULTISPECIES: LamG-like jellyroll fold domain-containing protein [unclassified Spirillospora]|uniref:LamG-like jellyroll fold domain-containing protein n=1 Tax=unclassified Spirillospora TaxID=2642701 RepID=UPI0037129F0C
MLVAGFLQVPAGLVMREPAAHADEPRVEASEKEALATAKQTGEAVEIASRRGETRTVRALPNGRIEIEQRVQPIRARQGGEWVDIDTTLRRSGDVVVPGATTVGLKFSGGGNGPMVQLTRAGRTLALSWSQALPEPTLDGDTAVYEGVAGPDVDLRLRARADGFAHVLVVKTAAAATNPMVAELVMAMSTTRLAVSEEPGSGVLKATDPGSGAAVFEAPSPKMWDSSQAGATSQSRVQAEAEPTEEPAEGAKIAPIDVAVGNGNLTLTPDQGLLTAPDTRFPVYIDPVWATYKASSWGMVSSGWPDQSYYKFAGKSTEGMGRCEVADDPNCVKNQTKRLFFRMSLPAIKGRYIQNVEFTAFETYAYNCSNPTSVQLWRTNTLQSYATWNNTNSSSVWDEHLTSQDVAYCSKTPVEFGGSKLRAHVQDAVNKGHSTITLGLKAYSESGMAWWKRFADDAYLKVQYNNPPLQPDTDTMYADPGTKCLPSGEAKTVNDFSTLYAYLRDPDDEDENKVQGQFTLHWANNPDGSDWGEKWTSALTGPKATNSKFDVEVPSTIPQGTKIGWGVRAWDGEQWGPWSYAGAQTGCYFYYDPAKPGEPTISSADYPQDGAAHGGVGQAGTFTISDPEGAADRFQITLNSEPLTTVTTTAGAARQVQIAPTRLGPNILTVQALAPSSQVGPSVSYEFRANAGSAPLASFKLDEPAGATTLQAVTRSGEPAVSAAVHGGVTAGTVGHVDQAVQLDGSTGYAATDSPVMDTSESFSVSAWVWVDASDPDNDFTVLSAEGNYFSGFYLKYVKSTQKWVFAKTAYDTNQSGWYQATSARPAHAGAWTHLVGVWDAVAKRLRIYVNGEKGIDSPEVTLTWNATGGLQIGRAKYAGVPVDYWPGKIDDVHVYDRILGAKEAEDMVAEHPVLKARWMLNTNGQADPFPEDAPDLQFHNGAVLAPDAGFGWGTSPAGLMLGAGQAFAETPAPPVWTDESFTIAGWVRNMGRPQQPATVFSQPGSQANVFALRYVPGEDPVEQGGWQVVMRNSDDAAATTLVASHSRFLMGNWVHVAVVYDALRHRVSLYVNGQLEETSGGVSQEDQVFPFKAQNNGGLQVGRNKFGAPDGTEFWPDAVDDVWAYQAALTPQQVAGLAVDTELPTKTGP